jgi:hypothetical protein
LFARIIFFMSEIPNLINYYKDCYQADTRTLSLSNIFSQKIENRLFVSGRDQILNSELPYWPIEAKYADAVSKNLSLYKREKEFYCAAFFIVGQRDDGFSKQRKVCAPLFLYPARVITENEFTYVQVNFEKRVININFLNSIKKEEIDDVYEEIQETIDLTMDDFSNVGKIKDLLEVKVDDINAEDILHYPLLHDEKRIKRELLPSNVSKYPGYRLFPAISFCVLKRSNATQGIISELNLMAKTERYSSSLLNLLSSESETGALRLKRGIVPAILSQSQREILNVVDKYRASLVIGPPGTGKSFTIAALSLDYMSKGKSVLIASKTDQAVDVIQKKIERDLEIPQVAFRAGRSDYKRQLKNQLKDLLSNTRRRPKSPIHDLKLLRLKLKSVESELRQLEVEFKSLVQKELEWGAYVADKWENPGFFSKLKLKYIAWYNQRQSPHWEVAANFLILQRRYIKLAREFTLANFHANVHAELYRNRRMFQDFLKSIRARTSSRQDLLFEQINLTHLLKTFPIWLVNMADIYDIFPLKAGVFDLAIIDEATQCDIASCLPIIQRAKRVVIVGDPKQLRHASFLSQSVQRSLQKKNNIESDNPYLCLDYRNTSILDLVDEQIKNQEQVCFLDEHYRSKPDIIDFSNKHFYSNSLRIMTSIPFKDKIQNQVIVEAGGMRDKNGVNAKEAALIIDEIETQIKSQAKIDQALCQTIGILSPFRDQVEYLGNLLGKQIALPDIQKHDIRCGTAYSFQGEERDVMFISLAIDENSHHSAILHLNKDDVFNVSITRARSKQLIFKSFSNEFNSGRYLGKFLSSIRNFESSEVEKSLIKDELLEEVKARLQSYSFECWSAFSVAGIEIDLLFKSNNQYFGIDLIGYPGEFEDALSIEDHKILGRAGVSVFPLPYSYWKFDEDRSFNELLKFAKAN